MALCTGSGLRLCGAAMAMDCKVVETASSRLIMALEALEAAVELREEQGRNEKMLAAQVQVLEADRSKLAAELDEQTAYTRRLEATNREIARRLDLAMETIRSVLGRKQTRTPAAATGKRRKQHAD
jgi:hypothetical protein